MAGAVPAIPAWVPPATGRDNRSCVIADEVAGTSPAMTAGTAICPAATPVAFDGLAASTILIVGAPRSGTTWLAKILDSHPDVLYRHEPDEIFPTPPNPPPDELRRLLRAWISDRTLRSVAKRPFFAKSWQSAPARWLRTAYAYALNAAERLPAPIDALARLPLPDFGAIDRSRPVIKSVRLNTATAPLPDMFPASRTLLILRHPGGQIDSLMRGTRQGRFDLKEAGTDMPFDEAEAEKLAAQRGVDAATFQALPDAAKYAWAWLVFNEQAVAALQDRPNARIVVYETLCAAPEIESRAILDFAGLAWNPQTAGFLTHSTQHDGSAGYYAVLRNSIAAADRWRTTMRPEDQAAIRAVMRQSPLARFWPDLAAAQ